MNWLEIVDEIGSRHEIPESGDFIIGRAPGCSLRILEPGVSRTHAAIERRDATDWIRDLSSSNGTWLLGDQEIARKVTDETSLRAGDRIRIGSVELIYHQSREESLDGERWSDVNKVGSGGMGEVLRAFDRDLGCLVAVKKIRSAHGDRAELLQRLHAREAAIGRGIDHPNVVRVLDDGIVEGSSVQVMEWVGGGDLSRSIQRLSREPRRAIEVIRQVALGLCAAHESGVVHADLKPGNILQVLDEPSPDAGQILVEGAQDEPTDPVREAKLLEQYQEQVRARIQRPPFVSRSGELALIEEAMLDGSRWWIPIFGERGVGRRRLALEARERHGDVIHVGDEFTIPPGDFEGVWLTPMPAEWPDESTWIEVLNDAKKNGWLREIHLRPLLPGPAARWIELLVEARAGDGAQFLSKIEASDGADGHPARLLKGIEQSLERSAWRLQDGQAVLNPMRLRESARDEAKRLALVLDGVSVMLRNALERIALFEGSLTGEQVSSLLRQDRAILHSLISESIELGLLEKCGDGTLTLVSDGLGQALAGQVSDRERAPLISGAADLIEDEPPATAEDPLPWLKRGRLLGRAGRYQASIEAHLIAAIAARSQYSRSTFIEALDEARAVIREAAAAGERRAIDAAERSVVGGDPRGLVAIERLRKLPIDVLVKIADFGIARVAGERKVAAGLAWGTPRYMSPEQARQEDLTPASDIYSLGLLAREITEGVHPLGNLRGADAIKRLARGELQEPMTDVINDVRWGDLLQRMLSTSAPTRPGAPEVVSEIAAIQARY